MMPVIDTCVEMIPHFVISLKCIVTDQSGNLLVVNTNAFSNNKVEKWNIPNGALKKCDVSITSAVTRIVREITAISSVVTRIAHTAVYQCKENNELQLWFVCIPLNHVNIKSETINSQWYNINTIEASKIPTPITTILKKQASL